MKMHHRMAISFSGDAAVDFVRGMIPHHGGALDMYRVLIEDLSCLDVWDPESLDGLVHFCNHVRLEQIREIAGMRSWLAKWNLSENTTCEGAELGTHDGHEGTHSSRHGHRRRTGENNHGAHGDHNANDGCGHIGAPRASAFIKINRLMHKSMSIRFGCDHSVDFVRGMIPHHQGAIAMCETLVEHANLEKDGFLEALCTNITRLQRAEIAWLHKWLAARGHSAVAPCGSCSDSAPLVEPPAPCEIFSQRRRFCHLLGGDSYCSCSDDAIVGSAKCGTVHTVDGFGTMNISAECSRTCGLCGKSHNQLFYRHSQLCPEGHSFVQDEPSRDNEHGSHGGHKHHDGEQSRLNAAQGKCVGIFKVAVALALLLLPHSMLRAS